MPKPRRRRSSKLDPYREYMDRRLSEGLENCVVLWREFQGLGYQGVYSLVKTYVSPRRRCRQVQATVRFETEPGEQAQVDWGSFSYVDEKGRKRRVWAFVMVLGWSRSIYVEFVRRADTASFIQCHVNAFDYLGGVPRRCLYDNAKVVTLGRDEEARTEWNRRMLDFALRLGFDLKLCQPYRAQTKGKVESGVKYVRGNLWPSLRFNDDADLNRQAAEWCTTVANRRLHGTTHRLPAEMLAEEQPHLGKLPERTALAPYLREDRMVARGEPSLWESISSRALVSCSTRANSAASPRCRISSQCLLARASTGADVNSFRPALGSTTVPMSRSTITMLPLPASLRCCSTRTRRTPGILDARETLRSTSGEFPRLFAGPPALRKSPVAWRESDF